MRARYHNYFPPLLCLVLETIYLIFFWDRLQLAYPLLNCALRWLNLWNGLQVPKLPLQVDSPAIIQGIHCGCVFHSSWVLSSFLEFFPLHTPQVGERLCPSQVVASPLVSCRSAQSNVSITTYEIHYVYAMSQAIPIYMPSSLCIGWSWRDLQIVFSISMECPSSSNSV